jgi:mono/diheme cytochrome c family protein
MVMKRFILIAIIFFVAACAGDDKKTSADNTIADVNVDGESLFKNNCASCHKFDKEFAGPALNGALERWNGDKKAMYEFIRNPAKSVVENAYAKQLFEKWNKTMMPASTLTDAELDAIMNYGSGAHAVQ